MPEIIDGSSGMADEQRPMIAGPGARLRAARKERNLSVADIKSALRFKDGIVEALEQDDYHGLPAPIFVKGYLRSYARLVGVGEEPVLAQYQAQGPSEPPPLVATSKPESTLRLPVSRPIIIGVLAAFIVIGAIFLFNSGSVEQAEQMQASASTQETVADHAAEKGLNATPGNTTATDPAIALPQEVLEADEVLTEAEMGLQYQPEPTVADISPVVVKLENVLRLSFAGNCWTEVRDRDGNRLLYALQRAGTSREIAGLAPFQVLLGNAQQVEVSYNGEAFDFQDHVRQNVARFHVGMEEKKTGN